MFKYLKIGRREIFKQEKMLAGTQEVLREILAQNRLILETNCLTMRILGQPISVIRDEPPVGSSVPDIEELIVCIWPDEIPMTPDRFSKVMEARRRLGRVLRKSDVRRILKMRLPRPRRKATQP